MTDEDVIKSEDNPNYNAVMRFRGFDENRRKRRSGEDGPSSSGIVLDVITIDDEESVGAPVAGNTTPTVTRPRFPLILEPLAPRRPQIFRELSDQINDEDLPYGDSTLWKRMRPRVGIFGAQTLQRPNDEAVNADNTVAGVGNSEIPVCGPPEDTQHEDDSEVEPVSENRNSENVHEITSVVQNSVNNDIYEVDVEEIEIPDISHEQMERDPLNWLYSDNRESYRSNEVMNIPHDSHYVEVTEEEILVDDGDCRISDSLETSVASNSGGNGSNFYFSNSREDVLRILQCYIQPGNRIAMEPETLSKTSSLTRLSTNKKMLVITMRNQLFKPRNVTAAGYCTSRCTFTNSSEGVLHCPGLLKSDVKTGNSIIVKPCDHRSRRNKIAINYIIRKSRISKILGVSTEEARRTAIQDADMFDVLDLIANSRTLCRSIGRSSANPTSGFHIHSVPGAVCLLDTGGRFDETLARTLIWKGSGVEHLMNHDTSTIYVDGKYSKLPVGFKQLFVIASQDQKSGILVPLLWCLTTKSDKATYRQIFETAKRAGLNPQFVSSDFEAASINATKEVWPRATPVGCWRHWKVNIRKNMIKRFGAGPSKSKENLELLKSIYSLSFAPLKNVIDWFNEIKTNHLSKHSDPETIHFFNYLSALYFSTSARFPPEFWNCLERAEHGLNFTNNPCEATFSKYSRNFSVSTQSLLRVVTKTVEWTKSTMLELKRPNSTNRSTATNNGPLYKNTEFRRVVLSETFPTFQRFTECVRDFMLIPKRY